MSTVCNSLRHPSLMRIQVIRCLRYVAKHTRQYRQTHSLFVTFTVKAEEVAEEAAEEIVEEVEEGQITQEEVQ